METKWNQINLGSVKINTFGNCSNISVSQCFIKNRNVKNKKNQGFGEDNADYGVNAVSVNWMLDEDIIDTISMYNKKM